MRKYVTFYKIMSGYEFIEFMKKFGWKHNGKYLKPHSDLSFSTCGYAALSETRRKFEGWDYWFGRCFPTDVLHEKTKITYTTCCFDTDFYKFKSIEKVLLKNGFKIEGE